MLFFTRERQGFSLEEKTISKGVKGDNFKMHILCQQTHLVKAMVFPVVTYGCESERRRIDAFELWC